MLDQLDPIWVDDAGGVDRVAAACTAAGWLALDTEADSLHSYFHKVCLIQVTADDRNFVIDPLALESSDLGPLWKVVEDPGVPVLMHGADYDLRVLDRDYGVGIRGLQDTQVMAQLLGESRTGLAALLEKEGGVALDKRHQRADWGRRPLTPSQVQYAAADTAFLGRLTARLRSRLDELGRWEWAEEEFADLETVRYAAPEPDPLAFERVKGARSLRGRDRDRAFSLFGWRDAEARRLDVPPFKVLGNQPLLELAQKPPESLGEIDAIGGIGPRFVRRWGRHVLGMVATPQRAPAYTRRVRVPELKPVVRRRVKQLTAARDEVTTEIGLEPGLVCPRSTLLGVAAHEPRCSDLEDLRRAGLTGWRNGLLGERFLAALAEG